LRIVPLILTGVPGPIFTCPFFRKHALQLYPLPKELLVLFIDVGHH
jgi:hypothetical protein